MDYPLEDRKRFVEDVAARVACGELVNKILDEDDMPSKSSYYKWLIQDDKLKEIHRSAMGIRAHQWFEEMIEVAKDGSQDYGLSVNGKVIFKKESVARSRLIVDTLKFACAKAHPMYAEKVASAAPTRIDSIVVNIAQSEKEKVIDIG